MRVDSAVVASIAPLTMVVSWSFTIGEAVNYIAVADTNLFIGQYGGDAFGACPGGIWLSTNSGAGWTNVSGGLIDPGVTALAVSGTNIFSGTWSRGVFHSTNYGTNWTAINLGLTDSAVTCFAVSGSNVFAGTAHGVFLTTNNGVNWTEVNTDLTDSSIPALTVSDSFVFAGTASGVWKRPLSEMITDVQPSSRELPTPYKMSQNYPNPFNPTTTINYQLPTQVHVTFKLFDVLGREVATLVNGVEEAGYKSVNFDASKLPSGVYFYRLQAGSFVRTNKMLLIK